MYAAHTVDVEVLASFGVAPSDRVVFLTVLTRRSLEESGPGAVNNQADCLDARDIRIESSVRQASVIFVLLKHCCSVVVAVDLCIDDAERFASVKPVAVLRAEDLIRVLLPFKVLCFLGHVPEAFQCQLREATVCLLLDDLYDVHGIDPHDLFASKLEANLLLSITPGVEEHPLVRLKVVVVEDDRVEALAVAIVRLGVVDGQHVL